MKKYFDLSFLLRVVSFVILLTFFFLPPILCAQEASSSLMEKIEGGTFLMGQMSPHLGDKFLSSNEQPIHRATLDDFLISRYEFTLSEALPLFNSYLEDSVSVLELRDDVLFLKGETDYPLLIIEKSLLKYDSSSGKLSLEDELGELPLTGVTWFGALFLCNALSEKEDIPVAYNIKDWSLIPGSTGYRLPTEAEWEYAARNRKWSYRHSKKEKPVGANIADISFSKKESKHSFEKDIDDGFPSLAPVGSFDPTENNLYDMRGNVQEWCYDYYSERYFEEAVARNNPTGPGEGVTRVSRGGDWQSLYIETRPTARTHWKPEIGEMFLGFRMARSMMNAE